MSEITCCYIGWFGRVWLRLTRPTSAAHWAARLRLHREHPAEWELVDGPAPDDYTHACTRHVGALLGDSVTTCAPLFPGEDD